MNKKQTILSFVVLSAVISTLILTGCGSKENVNEISYEFPKYDAVENNNENTELSGNDSTTNNGKKMMQEREQNRMPKEPIEACVDKGEGDTCSFTLMNPDEEENRVEGECVASPRDESALVCVSDDMPQNGHRGRPRAMNDSQ